MSAEDNAPWCSNCQKRIAGRVLTYAGSYLCERCYPKVAREPVPPEEESSRKPFTPDPEVVRQRQAEREEKAAREAKQRAVALEESRDITASAMNIAGGVLTAIGLWLLLRPSLGEVNGVEIANIHLLALGQTLTLFGGFFLVGAALAS